MEIQFAVLAALNPSTPEPLKSQAIQECDTIRRSPEGWTIALQLFSRASDASVKFFCCQILEECLAKRENIRAHLWEWVKVNYSLSEAVFIRNKLALLIILCFKNDYLNWTEFFNELLDFDINSDLRRIDLFLRTCVILDEEIVKNDQMMVDIKDNMRERAVSRLTSAWIAILNLQQDELSVVCLSLFGRYSAWIDIHLVMQNQFLGILFSSLGNLRLRVAAVETILDIICKGMSGKDKLALIQGFNLSQLIMNFDLNTNLEFDFVVAKLVNGVILEIVTALENSESIDYFLLPAFEIVDCIFPVILQFLAREEEEFQNIFSNLSVYLAFLKKLKKNGKYGILPQMTQRMESLLHVIVLKMRYSPNFDAMAFKESSEEEAQFNHFRRELKSHFDSIAILEPEMFSGAVLNAVCSTLNNFSLSNSGIGWPDVELAIFIVFILHESSPGPCVYVSATGPSQGSKTDIGNMLSLLSSTDISSYPHPSIPPIFFETIVRYASFFDEFSENIPNVLNAFVDKRGLHNPEKFIRNRVQYLFLRFVKTLKVKISPYIDGLLSSIQDCLLVEPPLEKELRPRSASSVTSQIKPDSSISAFESQLYLFEAAGKLISYEGDAKKQCDYLSIILTPIISQIQSIVNRSSSNMNDLDTLYIHHLILSIGSIAKGFPDFCASDSYVPSWHPIFRDAFKFICQILERLPNQNLVRESVRFSLQRLVGCMGTAIMADIIPIIKAGVLTGGSNGTSKELIDFLSFLGVLMFKFRTGFYPLLNEMIIPVHERAVHLINKQPLGTDDVMESLEVKRAYLSFLGNILNADLDLVLTSDINIHLLSSLLDLLLRALVDFNDGQSQKIVCAVLVKMVTVWGTDPENSLVLEKTGKKANVASTVSKNRLLSGFDEFIYKSILPILFRVPFDKKTFNLDDGQIQVLLAELSSLHRIIYISQGTRYLTYLTNFAFPSYGISAESTKSFITALSTMEPKNFKKFLQEFIRNHQNA